MRKSVSILCLLFCLSGSLSAYDLITPKGIGLGETVVLSHSSASELLIVPGGGLKEGGWSFETGYNRTFNIADLDRLYITAATRVGKVSVAIGALQFGKSDLYAEQTLKGMLAYHYDSLTIGASVSGMQVQIGNGYGTLRAITVGAGASFRTKRILGAVTADNLTSPRLADNSPSEKPEYSVYAELVGLGSYSFTTRATFVEESKPQFAIGQIWEIAERASLFWGVSTQPIKYGGGVQLNVGKGVFTYAVSIHPVLGLSHAVTFGMGTQYFIPREEKKFE